MECLGRWANQKAQAKQAIKASSNAPAQHSGKASDQPARLTEKLFEAEDPACRRENVAAVPRCLMLRENTSLLLEFRRPV